MSPRWTKVLRDIHTGRGRLLMIVVALAASIAAVTTMLSAYTVLMREVPRNYVGTNPASAQLELDGEVSDELLKQVRRRPNIAAAEAATTVLARIEVGTNEWLPMMLFVVPNFDTLRINTLHRESGAWPPPTGAMLVERSALPLTRTSVGRPVSVEFQQAGRSSMVIAGTVHDPGLAPAWQEQTVYGYVTPQTLARLGETVPLDLLKIVVDQGAGDAKAIEHTVRELSSWLTSNRHPVREARIPPPKLHPHQPQMNAVLVMLLIFSLLALLLGAMLTATVIGGLLAQQVRQIAIMKAIGARAHQVAGLYLALVGALAIAAVVIGLPLGLAAGRAFIALIAGLLNLRIDSLAFPWWLYAATLLIGLAAPLVAALVPIMAAARRTVKDAIDDHGVSPGALSSSWMPRALARIRITDAALNLAVRNMFRRRTRLVLTLSLLAGAGAMFVTSLNLKAAWENDVTQAAHDRHFDLELSLQHAVPLERVLTLAAAVPGVSHVEPWDVSRASIAGNDGLEVVRRYPDGAHGGFALRAAPPDTRLVAHTMIEGRWLQALDGDAVVINTLARAIAFRDVQVGDWVTLSVDHRPLTLRVVGVTRELLTPGAAYVTPDTFALATHSVGLTNAVRVALSDHESIEAVSHSIVQALEREQIGVKAVVTAKRFAAAQGGHVYILVFALGFIATMMAVVGLLGLASSLGTAVIERTREFGVMRAIGARSAAVIRSVLGEGVLIALLSWIVALVLSLPLSAQVGGVLASISTQELSLQLSPFGAGLWLCVVLLGSVVVSFYPAKRASQLTVRQTLAHI
jgi:putative ABC transport system permease protein